MENNLNQQNTVSPIRPGIFVTNPNLKALLLGLIVTLFLGGFGLSAFSIWSEQYRERIYYETEASLPVHKVNKTSPETSE